MLRALSEVRSRHNLVNTSFLTRGIAAAAYPYHSIPADAYHIYRDEYDSRYERGYLDGRRSCGDEFGGPYWRRYGEACSYGVEGYPSWGNELCPSCREAWYWGNDGRNMSVGRGYAPHWLNGDARWNQRTLDVYGWMNVDYLVGGRPHDFNPDCHPYRRNIGYFYDDGGRQCQGSEPPASPSWRTGMYPQTWSTYYREYDGGPTPSSKEHGSNYGFHWNDAADRQNQESRDIYGSHGYDQNARPQSTVDYNHSTVAERGRLERPDVSFHGHEYTNRFYDKNALRQSQQNLSSICKGIDGVLHENGPRNHNDHEGDQQSWDRYEWRNESNQPQSHSSEYPNRSYSENKNGFQKNLTEHRRNLNHNPEAGGQHYAHFNSFRNGTVLDRPEVKHNSSVNLDYKENIDRGRQRGRQRDVKGRPQSFSVKEQPSKMTDKRGKPYQSLEAYLQASNETATHYQQQQPQATSIRYTQKTDRNQHQAQQHSPTLNTARSVGVPEVLSSGSPIEILEPEQIRGTVEELETFTKEAKLMLAVKVLDVMEKKKDRLDPERDLSKIKMLIRACGDSKAVTEAKAVHKHIVNLMSPLKFSIYNKILGMYLKCGAVSDACSMFYNMAAHNLTSWDTMIKGLVKNNLGEEALDVFAEFKNTDSEPDGPMFLGVFSACRLVGDVIEGMLHFESMTKQYGIVPSMKHYLSIVGMMGHVGHLDEAMEFIEKMPVEPSVDVWETMMKFCRIHGKAELGDRCAEVVQLLDSNRLSEEWKAGLVPLIVSNLEEGVKEKEGYGGAETTDPMEDVGNTRRVMSG